MMRVVLISARLLFAFITFTALATSLIDVTGRRGISAIIWLSYFTNLTNLFVAVVLLVGAILLILHREPTELQDTVRGSATVSIAVVGVVFGLLLSGIENPERIEWVNFVVHYLTPVILVVDWVVHPPKAQLKPRHIWWWLLYPAAYMLYSLIHGAITDFYPYWFIDPNQAPGGWAGVVGFAVAILALFAILSLLLLWLGNRLKRTKRASGGAVGS